MPRSLLAYRPVRAECDAPVTEAISCRSVDRDGEVQAQVHGRFSPFAPNSVRAYDFVFVCATGQQLKCLMIVDEFTRECLAMLPAASDPDASSRYMQCL